VRVSAVREKRARLQRLGPSAAYHTALVSKQVPEAGAAIAAAETRAEDTKAAAAAAAAAATKARDDYAAATALQEEGPAVYRSPRHN